MACKATSTSRGRRRGQSGFLLAEAIIGIGITALLMLVVVSFCYFSGRSFVSLFNYVDLNDRNRVAIDQLTRDVRQANRVTSYTTNRLTLEGSDGLLIVYEYDPRARRLNRIHNGTATRLLDECDNLQFAMGQRNTIYGTYDVYPTATPVNCKVINVSWVCSRTVLGSKENTESVQTARIVIRKQGT